MYKLKISNNIYTISEDKSLLQNLIANDVYVNNPCLGKGVCGKCKVRIISGKVSKKGDTELKYLTDENIKNNIRLACQCYAESDIEIEVLDKKTKTDVLSKGYTPLFTVDTMDEGYGLAIDIGTTTVVVELVDLTTGKRVSHSSIINPQNKYGSDVLTRITYECENVDTGVNDLKNNMINAINQLINDVTKKGNVNKYIINKIVVAANLTMMHMFLGIDATSIGRYPYTPAFKDAKIIKAKNLGLDVNEDCEIICLPHVSAFIGADIVAGVYVCGLDKQLGNVLFIDIGTNAEIVLKTHNMLYSCSCAAGPALEGMNISCGMRAEEGAIEDVLIENDEVKLTVIGNEIPRGICGSGILAILKELLKNSFLKKNGAFISIDENSNNKFVSEHIKVNENNKKEFILCENPKLVITQSDIRQVQLSKGAILSGFIALLKKANITMAELDKVIVAGQFGSHLSAEVIVGCGILPFDVKNKIEYVGNVSKEGAYMALLVKNALDEMKKISQKINYFELADELDYEKIFVKAMNFEV